MSTSSGPPKQTGGVSVTGVVGQVGGSIVGGDYIACGGTKIVLGAPVKELTAALSKAIGYVDALQIKPDKLTTKKRKIFRKYLEPTYTKLRVVIEAYDLNLLALRKKIARARSNDEALEALQDYWINRRKTTKEREMLISTLESTLEYWIKSGSEANHSAVSEKLVAFIQAMRNYFVGAKFMRTRDGHRYAVSIDEAVDQRSIGSIATNIFNRIGAILRYSSENSMQEAIFLLDQALELTMERNASVHKSYNELRFHCEDILGQ